MHEKKIQDQTFGAIQIEHVCHMRQNHRNQNKHIDQDFVYPKRSGDGDLSPPVAQEIAFMGLGSFGSGHGSPEGGLLRNDTKGYGDLKETLINPSPPALAGGAGRD
jgi:hypothetical protein